MRGLNTLVPTSVKAAAKSAETGIPAGTGIPTPAAVPARASPPSTDASKAAPSIPTVPASIMAAVSVTVPTVPNNSGAIYGAMIIAATTNTTVRKLPPFASAIFGAAVMANINTEKTRAMLTKMLAIPKPNRCRRVCITQSIHPGYAIQWQLSTPHGLLCKINKSLSALLALPLY
jgi:hypothetical protein